MTLIPSSKGKTSSIQMQKSQVRLGLQKSLIINEIWQPVEMKWFQHWKVYVNFDAEGPDTRSEEVSYDHLQYIDRIDNPCGESRSFAAACLRPIFGC